MRKFLLLICLILCVTLTTTQAQDRTVSGKVTSSRDGSPLPGVNIVVKGTTNGTVTDSDGKYTLSIPSSGGTLIFSFIGLLTQEVSVNERTLIDVQMEDDVTQLGEVVVTAQGNVRQTKTIGYSTTTVENEEATKGRTNDLMTSLQGKVAGLTISQNSGAPGASSRVILRGYSSIGGNNQPLYIVDGVPINNAANVNLFNAAGDNFNNTVDYGNRANDIAPDDIESISILKSAAATALYGSRAANGAIIITTKRGKSGSKPTVDLITSATFNRPLKLPELQNTFGQGWSSDHLLDENGSWGPRLDGTVRRWGNVVDNSQQLKPFTGQPDNLKDFYETGYNLNNSLTVSGGSDAATYYFNYGNISADGFIPGDADQMKRHNFSVRSTLKSKKLTSDISMNYVRKDIDAVATGQGGNAPTMFQEIIQMPRDMSIVDFKDYKNKFNNIDGFHTRYAQNPYFSINENGNQFGENRIYGKLGFTYNFNEWINLTYRVGADVASSKVKEWTAKTTPTPGSPNQTVSPTPGTVNEGSILATEIDHSLLLNSFVNLNSSLTLSTLGGLNVNERSFRAQTTQVVGLDIPGFYDISNSSSAPIIGMNSTLRRLIGLYAQAELGYKDYLFLTATVRNDWSSTLPKANQSFMYPAVNTSFVFTEALGMENSVLNFGKLRMSWGQTGNDAQPYLVNSTLAQAQIFNNFGTLKFPFDGVNAFEVNNRIGNQNLQPEISTEFEFGGEFKLLNNKVGLNVSFYDKRSDGQILNVPVASTSGYTTQTANVGLVQNKGIELLVSLTPVETQDFRWDININYTKNNNKILDLPEQLEGVVLFGNYGVDFKLNEGRPIGDLYAPDYLYDPQGRIVVNANGIPVQSTEKSLVGNINPNFVTGLNTSLTYKNISLSGTVDYRDGGKFWSYTKRLTMFVGNDPLELYNDRRPFVVPNSVRQVGESYVENDVPVDMSDVSTYWNSSNNPAMERRHILDRTYLKVRELVLAYNLPSSLVSKTPFTNISASIVGRNLWIWTPTENNVVDPEATQFGNDLAGEFGEFAAGPSARSLGFTLKLGL
ncbi:MAG TPA: SusC/RagA family TonB-linked outer membrane protein [Chryseosolibacter sp.]|nr:SusC/RagA family TonB-linked outer membrane protein [Chryseosolibacter sp.]